MIIFDYYDLNFISTDIANEFLNFSGSGDMGADIEKAVKAILEKRRFHPKEDERILQKKD